MRKNKQTAQKTERVLSSGLNINFNLSHELVNSFTSKMICLIAMAERPELGVLNGKSLTFCFLAVCSMLVARSLHKLFALVYERHYFKYVTILICMLINIET